MALAYLSNAIYRLLARLPTSTPHLNMTHECAAWPTRVCARTRVRVRVRVQVGVDNDDVDDDDDCNCRRPRSVLTCRGKLDFRCAIRNL